MDTYYFCNKNLVFFKTPHRWYPLVDVRGPGHSSAGPAEGKLSTYSQN